MREVNSINMKNEEEANIFVAKVMRVAICVFTLVFVLNIVGIFVVKTVPMTVAYISGVVLLIIPTILVNILKLNKPCLKYIFVTLAVLTVSVFTVTINWHVVIFYSFAIGVATLYFSKGLSIYATVISVVFYSGAQIIAYNCNFTIDRNVSSMNDMILYCVLPRAMALITLSALFLALATRTRKMLDTLLDADKQFKIMKQMEEMKEKSINVSDSLVHNIEILSEITVNTKQNNEQVAKISETATQASENTLEQLNNVTGNIENISNNLSELVDKTSQISKLSLDVQQFSINNVDNMKHISQEFNNITDGTQYSKEIINELRDKSQEIGQITQTITDISSQTNLLALNASIEAARAGEAGKGFAVVAEEIRNLAEQTNNSVADISSIIESFVDNTMKAVVSMDKNTTIISEGINIIKKTDDMSNDMVRCTDEMNSKINSVSNLIKQVSQFSNEIVDIIKDVQSISTESRDDLQKVSSGQASAGEEIKKLENIVESINEITKELQEVIK